MGQRVNGVGELNRIGEAKGNRVRKGRGTCSLIVFEEEESYERASPEVDIIRPEAGRSSHDQGEGTVTRSGGPHSLPLKS